MSALGNALSDALGDALGDVFGTVGGLGPELKDDFVPAAFVGAPADADGDGYIILRTSDSSRVTRIDLFVTGTLNLEFTVETDATEAGNNAQFRVDGTTSDPAAGTYTPGSYSVTVDAVSWVDFRAPSAGNSTKVTVTSARLVL